MTTATSVATQSPKPDRQPSGNRPKIDLATAEQMRADGASHERIAAVFGVSVAAVAQALYRVRKMREAGESPPPAEAITVLDVELQLRGVLAETLIREARQRGVEPVELLARTIELVVADNLFTAVLG